MFSESKISGKHMICDIKGIKNILLLHSLNNMLSLLDTICKKYDFSILEKVEHRFHPEGISILYLLSESHLSIHTFPEKSYIAFDLYTCRQYDDNTIYNEIYDYLIDCFSAEVGMPIIIDRSF
jgi:S-adenosylmethionine decarboxylase proenzyme